MRTILSCLLVLMMSTAAIAMDSEIAIFDEAQSAFSRFEDSQIEAWKKIDVPTAAFHAEWKKLDDLSRKRNRLVFLYRLQNDPEKIHWNSWKGWLRPIESSTESESYKETIPGYRDITSAFEKQKALLTARNDLLVRRNSLYGKNKEIFDKLDKTLSEELSVLEKRMDAVRKSKAPQDTAPVPGAR